MRRDLQFMGRMTAGMTHEINNVLAVIRESAGLAQDLATLGEAAEFAHRDRIVACLGQVQTQIDRGGRLTRALNRFAHSVDHDRGAASMEELIGLTVALNDRHARQHRVTLEYEPGSDAATVETDLFLFVEALSRLIVRAVASLEGEGKVLLSCNPEDTGMPRAVRVTPQGALTPAASADEDPTADLAEEMASCGLSVVLRADNEAPPAWLFCAQDPVLP